MEHAKKTSKSRVKGHRKLGDLLVESGLIDRKTLAKALEIQKIQNKRLGRILIDMGVADDEEIARTLARQLDIPFLKLSRTKLPEDVISMVPADLAENHLLLPVKKDEKGLLVAMANPLDLYALDDLRFVTRMPVRIAVAPQKEIIDAIGRYYPRRDLAREMDSEPRIDEGVEIIQRKETEDADLTEIEDILDLTERPPVVRLTNAILADAIKMGASDIHIEPQKTTVLIRYRIDGILREIMQTDRHVHASLVSRIKVISNMDVTIRRKPQDGKSQIRYGNRIFDLRVSTIPTSYGEKVTIRLLNPDRAGIGLDDLGFPERELREFKNAIDRPQGLILVTGPTGSGKSSTLYACLNRLRSPEVNIITVEDPVEYDVDGVNQVQINPKAGITFAAGLRSILRQDPDIVMVGEIRDAETASIAMQAAQTGHMVLSTLHTNDACSAVTRLLDLGVEPFLISASLMAVVGQRLVRKICDGCRVPDPLTPRIVERIPPSLIQGKTPTFWKGAGCEACNYTGYSGRMGLFEVLFITPSLREMIVPGASAAAIREKAMSEGFRTLSMDGMEKALQGLTTIEEVFRVAPPETTEGRHEPLVEMPGPEPSEPDATEEGPPAIPPSSVRSVSPRTVLVADDNEIILKIIRNLLESEDYRVITAHDGMEALKLALQEKPDMVITDYLMPKMNGMALINKLKSQLTTRYIPIIMLTAKDDVDLEVKGIDAGADDYLTKPVNAKLLMARIRRLMERPGAGAE